MTFSEYYDEQIKTAKAFGLALSEAEKRQIAEDWVRHEKKQKALTAHVYKSVAAQDEWERRWAPWDCDDSFSSFTDASTRKDFDDWMNKLGGSNG